MRDIGPFDYWQNHSSAIAGLGGTKRSPDPRYLFHTGYHQVRAGHARFVLKMHEVRATFGELSVRVHAWKPETDSNIILVSGARMVLHGESDADLTLPVHFASQKGVLYALYGYLSEDSDVIATTLQVAIDEQEDTGERLFEPPRSMLAVNREAEEARPANALLHYGRTETSHPVSQSCTVEQVAALGLRAAGSSRRAHVESNDAAMAAWSETLCLNALMTYGATDAGLEGLVVGPVSADYAHHFARSASVSYIERATPPARTSDDFFDFLLMPAGLDVAAEAISGLYERWEAVEDWLARLKIGGLAVLALRYRPDSDLVSSSATADTRALSRNEIGQWSLRLIGNGYSVAPMAFAPLFELVVDSHGLAAFLLIVQRL